MKRLFQKKQDGADLLSFDERFVRQSQEWSAAGRPPPPLAPALANHQPDTRDRSQSPGPHAEHNVDADLSRSQLNERNASQASIGAAVYESRPDIDSSHDRAGKKKGFRFKFPGTSDSAPSHKFTQATQPRPHAFTKDELVARIGWLCATGNDDWSKVLELCDEISRSDMASRESSKALRKEIKYGTPETQQRAVRLMTIMMWNTSDKFRLLVASKKFLEVVEDVAQSKKTDQRVVAMIHKAFGALAYDYQDNPELSVITSMYNKIKAPDAPPNGTPLDEADTTFDPTQQKSRRAHMQQQQALRHGTGQWQNVPRRDIKAETEVACNNARLLMETLTFTPPTELATNDIIREFHTKCIQSQSVLMDDIPWATAQAEQSRAALMARKTPSPTLPQNGGEGSPPPIPAATRPLSTANPYAALVGSNHGLQADSLIQTREEEILAALLAANTYLVEAFKQYDEAHRHARRESEIKKTEEVSRRETKFDRSKATQRSDGDWDDDQRLAIPNGPEAGGSRSPSPAAVAGQGEVQASRGDVRVSEVSESSANSELLSNNPYATLTRQVLPPQPYQLDDEDVDQHEPPPRRFEESIRSPLPIPPPSQQYLTSSQISPEPLTLRQSPPPIDHLDFKVNGSQPDELSDLVASSQFLNSTYQTPNKRQQPTTSHDAIPCSPTQFSSRNPFASVITSSRNSNDDSNGSTLMMPKRQETTDSIIVTPIKPSEKALGKMRRFSTTVEGSDDEAQVQAQQLEEEERLMQRYR